MMTSYISKIFTCALAVLAKPSFSVDSNALLLIISFDGFRYDYLERNLTDVIVKLRLNSSFSPYMTSVFPTKTFPNHFSIATGLYAEVHGVLDNEVFDQLLNKTLKYGYEMFHYNDDIIPIWTLNEMAGGNHRSGCMMWPGSNFKYHDTIPSHYMSYNASVKFEDRVDTLLSWFIDPQRPINLGMMYFEQPDLTCHQHGPDSEEVNKEIARVNRIVKYLLEKVEEAKLLNKLNIIFLSDHGGQAVKVPNNLINLDDFVNRNWYFRAGITPNLQIYPIQEKETEVLAALKDARMKGGNFSTYSKEEIPEQWHYKHCSRVPPIYITADVGYFFNTRNWIFNTTELGTHGYDPKEPSMQGFFMAVGPAFRQNHSVPPFQNIHIYPLAAHLLGLTLPSLKPNGSLSYLKGMLTSNYISEPEEDHKTTYIVIGLLIIVTSVLVVFGCLVRRHYQHKAKFRNPSTASYKSYSACQDI